MFMQPSACHFHDLSIGGKEHPVFGRGILAVPTPHSNLPYSNYLGALVWSWGASGPGATGAQEDCSSAQNMCQQQAQVCHALWKAVGNVKFDQCCHEGKM